MKKIFLLLLVSIFALSNAGFLFKEKKKEPKRVAMIVSQNDFSDEELIIPMKSFKEEGYIVKVASQSIKEAKGVEGSTVIPDITLADLKAADFDAIIFVGGPGAEQYWNSLIAHDLARSALEHNRVLAAICIAPVTLANAGALEGKKATVWYSQSQLLKVKGANYTGRTVEVDSDIVTANGPLAAQEFAQRIIKILEKKKR